MLAGVWLTSTAPLDDEGQRRPRLANPRNAEVRLLAGGCRPTLSPAALPVAEQSSHAGAVTAVSPYVWSRSSGPWPLAFYVIDM
jgi:hypothetical protein